jgi:hypothetical protein
MKMTEAIHCVGTCEAFSRINQNECRFTEPDDSLDLYFDFMKKINPYDYVNDHYLDELLQRVFNRKKAKEDAKQE